MKDTPSKEQIAREAKRRLDATLAYRSSRYEAMAERIIQAAIDKAWSDGYVEGSNYQLSIHTPAAQPQPSRGEINDCQICGEDALVVTIHGQAFVRVRRKSKCKKETPCKTDLYDNPSEAIKAWNSQILT